MVSKENDQHDKEDYSDSIPFRFERTLPDSFLRLVDLILAEVLESEHFKGARPKTIAEVTEAIKCIVANLIAASKIGPNTFVAVSRKEGDYKRTRYHRVQFGYTNAIHVLDFLEASRFVVFKRGFYDRRGGRAVGKRSRYRFTSDSRRFIASSIAVLQNPDASELVGRNLTHLVRRTTALFGDLSADIFAPSTTIVSRADAESIRLKDAQDNFIEYEDDGETNRMRENLRGWNAFLTDNHHVDLLLSDEELLTVCKQPSNDDENPFFEKERKQTKFVEFDRNQLYRVFNHASFKQGGRFYGGWWQLIPSQFRHAITINGHLTCEVDYSNLHAAMLYARVGGALAEDAYSLPNVDDDRFRPLIKTTFFKLINAGKGQRMAPPKADALPPGMSWEEFQKAIIAKHEPIREYLHSGAGLELQRIDSDIAEDVMLALMKKGILALPVHDSFVTYHDCQDVVRSEMKRAYQDAMKADIGFKVDDTFWELWNKEAAMPVTFDAYDVALNTQARAGYEGYRLRLESFVKSRPDGWAEKFGEPPY